ncbi:hypothetical protein AB0I10_40625 [Streptomyces sp. NPDC050636]|uniref:hypothetical protein n=1 Tax=Streptomyces sp. NPDC050636 TaxID=3154510 RepID=UPI0034123AFE
MSLPHLTERPTAPITEPAPPSRPGRAALRKAHRAHAGGALPGRYLGYVGYFVGAGLISGAIVHHPLDPARYTRIAGYGVLVFLAATVLNEVILKRDRPSWPRMLLVLGASLMLSFGIGMLSGGLQHFEDFPDRAAVLVPLGLALSFVAYTLKEASTPLRRIFSLFGLAVLVTSLIAFAGLRQLAADIAEQPAGHGHSHGSEQESKEEPTEDGHGDTSDSHGDEEGPSTEPVPPTATPATPEKPGDTDGHDHAH